MTPEFAIDIHKGGITRKDEYCLSLKPHRRNCVARHQHSLVNICSYRIQEHFHIVLEHDRNTTPTDIRLYLHTVSE